MSLHELEESILKEAEDDKPRERRPPQARKSLTQLEEEKQSSNLPRKKRNKAT